MCAYACGYICVYFKRHYYDGDYLLSDRASIQYVVGFRTTESREVSKPRDMDIEKSDRSDI